MSSSLPLGQHARLNDGRIYPYFPKSKRAFSLVEVVMAVAILAFGVISLLGLLAVAAKSSRDANNQAAQAAIVSTVTSKLQTVEFTTQAAALPSTSYFTADGVETNAAAAIYQCTVTDVSPTGSPIAYMRMIQISTAWPAPAYTQTNIVVASFAKYD